eukprot:8966645-Pyramimonas_sp.AAC.1
MPWQAASVRGAQDQSRIETEYRDLQGSSTSLKDVLVQKSTHWQQKWASSILSVQRLLRLLRRARLKAAEQP